MKHIEYQYNWLTSANRTLSEEKSRGISEYLIMARSNTSPIAAPI